MNRNPGQVNVCEDGEPLGMNGQPLIAKVPYYAEPEKTRITLKEKITQQSYQVNELENILREIETKVFGDIRGDKVGNNAEQVYKGIESVITENGETLERCLKLAYSITERI